MRIGLDSDGVIYNFTHAYNQKLLSLGHQLDVEAEAKTWDFYKEYGYSDADFFSHLDDMVDNGEIFWTGQLYEPYIPWWIDTLREAGHTIHIVTNRHSGKVLCSKEATKHFFREMKINYDSLTFTADKTSVKTDIFLEDHLKNYDQLESAGVESWLVNRPYNQATDKYRRRVTTFEQFCEKILIRDYHSRMMRSRKFGLPARNFSK